MGKNGNNLRLRYSGLIVFTTQLLGVITGLIFTLLLTRSMTADEFGIWTNIFDYTPYFILVSGILPFWVTRFTARDKESAIVTGSVSQLFIGLIATLAYLPVIYFISNAIGTTQYLPIYLLAGFNVLTIYLINIFEAALTATKPHATGYGFIIQEIVKVVVALVLILGFKQVFLGAILALVIAPAAQTVYYTYLLRRYFKEHINWSYLKQWLKSSPVLLYNVAGVQLLSFVFILLYLYGGTEARAYYQAALSFTTIVGYASSLAVSLYPKMLSNACSKEEVGLSLKTVLMLAIPLATLTMVMAVAFLTVLNVIYTPAWPVLIILTVDTLIVMLTTFYTAVIMGSEAFDAAGQIRLKDLVKSKVFKLFSIPYLQAAIALPVTYFVLTELPVDGPVITAVAVVAVLILVHLGTFMGLAFVTRRIIHVPIAWKSLAKYIFAALIMGLVLYFVPATSTLLATIAKTVAGFALYCVIVLAIDETARELIGLVWKEIMGSLKQLTQRNSGKNQGLATEN